MLSGKILESLPLRVTFAGNDVRMIERRAQRMFVFLTLVVLASSISCREDKGATYEDPYERTAVTELAVGTDFTVITSGNNLVARGQDGFLYVWSWSNLSEQPRKTKVGLWYPESEYSGARRFHITNEGATLMHTGKLLYASHTADDTTVVLKDIDTNERLNEWALGKGKHCRQLMSSRNGKYVAVFLEELYQLPHVDKVRKDYGEMKFGVMDYSLLEVRWISSVRQYSITLPMINQVAVSEDGKYLVAVGSDNGGFAHMADVENEKVLWEKNPRKYKEYWTVNFNAVCFSPDSKRAYVGSNGGVFIFEVATGEISDYWRLVSRIVSVDATQDGRLVAAGSVGSGLVYVLDAQTGQVIGKRIDTAQYSVYSLAFSPDSRLLATSGVKNTGIKIWEMPLSGSQGGDPNN